GVQRTLDYYFGYAFVAPFGLYCFALPGYLAAEIGPHPLNTQARALLQIIQVFIGQLMLMTGVCKNALEIFRLALKSEQQGSRAVLAAGHTYDVVDHGYLRECWPARRVIS